MVIPCYNYAHAIKRAIDSVKAQTLNNLRCVIVDDGSTDDTKDAVLSAIRDDRRFAYIYQPNSGVAIARNTGVFSDELAHPNYICCLDADDAISPEFLEVCVDGLEKDPSIAIVYTGLWYIKPTGEEGLSPWPGEFNYDKQLERQNQIPTCNVSRYEVWERLGGQRQRYAPDGAGEEDAEMWTRAGAYGFRAKKITDAGLFRYSWMSGRVSGDRTHKITDFLAFHPWAKDGLHPFMSVAEPKSYSHPVRQYDEPTVSVIIPVGPGHESLVIEALDSLEAQTLRKWEAIIVDDTAGNSEKLLRTLRTYPYIKYILAQKHGAGSARNTGARIARAPFLVFLDADDYLLPNALRDMLNGWEQSQAIIYTDHLGKAILSDEEAKGFKERLIDYNQRTKTALFQHGWLNYDCDLAARQPTQEMYHWCLVTTLVPKDWHNEIGGFDEEMESWEDWDYYIRMAQAGKCFARLAEYSVVYRYYTGERREDGLKDYRNLIKYMREKYKGNRVMPCNCKDQNQVQKSPDQPPQSMAVSSQVGNMNDHNFKLITYAHPNRGQHRVVGGSTQINYGYRAYGDKFLVHLDDIRVQPHIFIEVETVRVQESPQVAPPPPPTEITEPPEDNHKEIPAAIPEISLREEEKTVFDLSNIPGISSSLAILLSERGIKNAQDVIDLGVDGLLDINEDIGKRRAAKIIEGAKIKAEMQV